MNQKHRKQQQLKILLFVGKILFLIEVLINIDKEKRVVEASLYNKSQQSNLDSMLNRF